MKRYWDYDERERALMTREVVQSLLKFELMEAGVENVQPIELEEIPEVTVSKKTMWRVGYDGKWSSKSYFDCLFETQEQATAFTKLKPSYSDSDYTIGSNYTYPVNTSGLCIESVEVFDHASVLTVKPQLQEIAAIKKRNDELTTSFNEKSKKVDSVCDGVWDDWHECGRIQNDVFKVQSTYKEYLGMCGGDAETAQKFLRKTCGDDRVDRAIQWLGEELCVINESLVDA